MIIRLAAVCHARDGYQLRVAEVPLWAVAADVLSSSRVPVPWLLRTWLAGMSVRAERAVDLVPVSFEDVCDRWPAARVGWDDDGVTCSRGVMLDHVQEQHGRYGVVS